MILSALIRKRATAKAATAIPAIAATQLGEGAGKVARIATVAVADPTEAKPAKPEKVSAGGPAAASCWWLIHYAGRDPVEVTCSPPATHAEILERHPDAIVAEAVKPIQRQPSCPLTCEEEMAIRAWLAHIEETDDGIIADVLNQCRLAADARAYFIWRAGELRSPERRLCDGRG